jgi:hypothetical protein
VAQKMNDVIMPRRIALMPQVQQRAREFAAEQKAKCYAAASA